MRAEDGTQPATKERTSRSARCRIGAVAAAFACITLAAFGGTIALLVRSYLREYAGSGWAAAAIGIATVAAAFVLRRKLARRRGSWSSIVAAALALGAIIAVAASANAGRISWARFGLTIYGVVPVPFFDITVDADGRPWFRNKTHRVTIDEVLPLIDDATEIVVIGVGWDSMAQVDVAVRQALGPRLLELPTAEAFEAYEAARAAGRRVALLAHTTC